MVKSKEDVMAYSEAQKRATMKWEARNYDKIQITAPKGFKAKLEEASQRSGKPYRQFVMDALMDAIEKTTS